jgi:tetratricopeptide (TPR) repeat protein
MLEGEADDFYRTALELAQDGRTEESIPYFQRAIQAGQGGVWELEFDYASALYNLTRTYHQRRGMQVPALRSSYEQVQAMVECLRHLKRAEELAPSAEYQAVIEDRRAQMMSVWGFPWEALDSYRRAAALDSTHLEFGKVAEYERLMRSVDESR